MMKNLNLTLEKLNLGPRKKLLVLSPNGLLLQRLHYADNLPKDRYPDLVSGNFIVFTRPFCDEFLKFCFENFDVGIWSSGKERSVDHVLDSLMGMPRYLNLNYNKLKFVWDQRMSTNSGFDCLEKEGKPILLKELKKLWEEYGKSSSSNTLLIDNEPYKALLNPPNTAIFPEAYDVENDEDTFLGPNGELRTYLEGLANADSVTSYVKDHPFGQPEITPAHADYEFYKKIIHRYKLLSD